jgi:hypothetical protein
MENYNPLDPDRDPFKPPEISILVGCLHCGEEYDSYRIEWRIKTDRDGKPHGFWCCPTPGCDGLGFGFDILPCDPDYEDENFSYVHDDEDDEGDDFDIDEEADLPSPRRHGTDDDEALPF